MRLFFRIIRRHLGRRAPRTLGTVLGIAMALFIFLGVESLGAGLSNALSSGEAARTLIVYRENRYCPQTSFLPERYRGFIEDLPEVEGVLPVKVHLSNCRASLDVVAFQGTPVADLVRQRDLRLVAGDLATFERSEDTALVGREFAARRGLEVGDAFRFGDISVRVAGIHESSDPVQESLILTHLEFLQRAGPVNRLGTVTQFEVLVKDAAAADVVARAIDERFRTEEEPTDTRPKAAFLETATRELQELLTFGRAFGAVCVLVVLVLVANTVVMSVEERKREFGIYLALGFRAPFLVGMVLMETLLLVGVGAGLGLLGAFLFTRYGGMTVGVEGVAVAFTFSTEVVLLGIGVALACGILSAVVPAVVAARTRPRILLGGG